MAVKFVLAVGMVGFVCLAQANRMVSVKSAGDFYSKIRPRVQNQLTLAAVLFYDGAAGAFSEKIARAYSRDDRKKMRAHRSQLNKSIKQQREAFGHAGKAMSEVAFLIVDVSRKSAIQLQQAYHLTHFPVVLLFKNGKLLVTKQQKTITLQGDLAKNRVLEVSKIIAFVQRYLGKEIKSIIQAKAKAEFELAKARASAPRVYAPYWGYGWGGYGWGYGYPGWGWGGCGWGGCW